MKNLLTVSALVLTLNCAAAETQEPSGDFVGTIGERDFTGTIRAANFQEGNLVGTICGPLLEIESIDENGWIHIITSIDSWENEPKVGDIIPVEDSAFIIESVESIEGSTIIKIVVRETTLE